MDAYSTETITTDAGDYTVALHTDMDAENPLTNWDHTGMGFWVNYNSSRYVETDTLPDNDAARVLRTWVADEHDQDDVMRRYNKWRAITGSTWVLVAGEDSASRSDHYGWFGLVNTAETYVASDGNTYPVFADPVGALKLTMDTYRTWAAGEVCGFVTTAPDGSEVATGWGFYDDDEALSQGRDAAEHDAAERVKSANLVGAGFVGVL